MKTHPITGLKRARLLAGLSQQDLAGQVGITRQVVADYEAGRTIPRLDVARQFAELLRVDMDALFPKTDHPGEAAACLP